MVEFFSYKKFIKNLSKNKIALNYAIQKNVKRSSLINLIENTLSEKNSFVFESVEKAIYRGRYTIIGFDPDKKWEIINNTIYINNKKILKKYPYIFLKKIII